MLIFQTCVKGTKSRKTEKVPEKALFFALIRVFCCQKIEKRKNMGYYSYSEVLLRSISLPECVGL